MNHTDITDLLLRRLQGIATAEENHQIEAWADQAPENRATLERLESQHMLKEDLGTLFSLVDGEEGKARLRRMDKHIRQSVARRPVRRMKRWLPYAAAAVIISAAMAWLLIDQPIGDQQVEIVHAETIQPGGNRATLTLADGRTVVLDETQKGIIVDEQHITYVDGRELFGRETTGTHGDLGPQYAILTTPRGGTYQVTLPDGTEVWLNAASSLRYPTAFTDHERVVEIMGEGYFAVARDNDRPFKVISSGQTIEVLGTEFNVTAYPDEHETKTTLVIGKVKVGFEGSSAHFDYEPFTLLPGQQGIVGSSSARVAEVDVNQYTAWKDGFFYFNGDSPQEAFAQLSRWYDIELVYANDVPTVEFYGKLERDKSLGSLLRILEQAGLEFKVVSKGRGFQLIVGNE